MFGSLGDDGLFTETTAYAPNSPYSASKASSDHLVRAWRETYELPTLVTNCSNNYGPYHFPEKLIPHMIIKGLAGRAAAGLWRRQEHPRLALCRGSCEGAHAGARARSRSARPTTSAAATSAPICTWSRASATCSTMSPRAQSGPRRDLITFVADRPGHDRRYAIDASKLERELGWRAEENFESGIEKTVRWYVDQQPWWRTILERGYAAKRVGLNQ